MLAGRGGAGSDSAVFNVWDGIAQHFSPVCRAYKYYYVARAGVRKSLELRDVGWDIFALLMFLLGLLTDTHFCIKVALCSYKAPSSGEVLDCKPCVSTAGAES